MAGHPGADRRAHHAERNPADQREKSPDHRGGARQARGAGILVLYSVHAGEKTSSDIFLQNICKIKGM